MSHVESPADVIADLFDLFDLDAQVGPLHELPSGMDSEDCTSDTCTQSCMGCAPLS
ncbi:FDLD family class I lanthipeptide [Sphaerisporangium viridialbum]|uniref:FDLD family class I lanthipeptide n=1 Tax=Sphaerisporangium viridialbum TaxID=46189 RepID=UPI003C780EDB